MGVTIEHKFIKDFDVSEKIIGFYIIKSFNVKTSKNGNMYLDLYLQDNSGDINAKLWNIQNDEHERFNAGDIVKVAGIVTEWQGNLQFKISEGKFRQVKDSDDYDIQDLIASAPMEPQKMYDFLMEKVDAFDNEDLKQLTNYFLEDYKEKLLIYPAAKMNHHAIRAGLLYHINRMIKVGEQLAGIYESVDSDLLITGIILHDIEKINEMEANELGVVEDYTPDGQMLGHLVMGVKNIATVAAELGIDEELSMMVQHMLLSHHYYPEYGSPKKPMFVEAELLHHIDMIDARVYDFETENKNLEPGQFSDRVYTLDNRRIYKRK